MEADRALATRIFAETRRNWPLMTVYERFEQIVGHERDLLSEDESKELLATYGIPVVQSRPAGTADDAVTAAGEIGYPVVLKIRSPQITHKTDVGGVALDLPNEAAVRQAFDQIVASARRARPDADLCGPVVGCVVPRAQAHEVRLESADAAWVCKDS